MILLKKILILFAIITVVSSAKNQPATPTTTTATASVITSNSTSNLNNTTTNTTSTTTTTTPTTTATTTTAKNSKNNTTMNTTTITTKHQPICECQTGDYTYKKIRAPGEKPSIATYRGIICDCSSRNLTSFPTIKNADKVIYLDLSNNKFENTMGWRLGEFKSLNYLNTIGNPIKDIEANTFAGLFQLREPHLQTNSLISGVDLFGKNNVDGQNLLKLMINGNGKLSTITKNLINDLSQLEELSISKMFIKADRGDKLQTSLIDGHPTLTSISIQDSTIDIIEEGAFQNLPKLVQFIFTKNGVRRSIDSSFIKSTPNLKILILANNPGTGFISFGGSGLPGLFKKTFLDEMGSPELQQLDLSENFLRTINLKNLNVRNLDLSRNQLDSREDGIKAISLEDVWVQNLNMSNSIFGKLTRFYTFPRTGGPMEKYANEPQTIDLTENRLEDLFEPGAFSNFHQLYVLDLSGRGEAYCNCRTRVLLTTLPKKVIIKGTCMFDNVNNQFLALLRQPTKQLMDTSECNFCSIINPCLNGGSCKYVCLKWYRDNAFCLKKRTQCQCETGFSGRICEFKGDQPSSTPPPVSYTHLTLPTILLV